jgi:hypothetical protein
MNASVLTEGNFDGMFLATLIAEEQQRDDIAIEVVGKSGFFSYARTLLAVKRIPVAVVIDAHSPEPDMAMERQSSAEEVIGAASFGIPFRVIVAVPELGILFFQRPELLRRVFGEAVNDHLLELAQLSPRRALEKLAPGKPLQSVRLEVLKQMDDADIHALRETDLIQQLLDFIKIAVAFSSRSAVTGTIR